MGASIRINTAEVERLRAHVLRRVKQRVVYPVAADIRRYAPVLTGRMRASVSISGGGPRWTIHISAPYTGYVEFGHRLVDRSGRTIGFVPPQPFVRPAVYQRRAL